MNLVRTLTKLFRQLDTPLSRARLALLEKGGLTALLDGETVRPQDYVDSHSYFKDACAVEIVRKLKLPMNAQKAYKKAVDLFWASEAQCKKTNMRLMPYHPVYGSLEPHHVGVSDFINQWRKNIRRILKRPSLNLTPRFSPGATLSNSGKEVTIPDKMLSEPTCYVHTPTDLYRHYFRGTYASDKYTTPRPMRANRFFTVRKDWDKDRGCCVEALVNVQLQLAVGAQLKDRLGKTRPGPLEERESKHHAVAKHASLFNDYSTIDLSNASDTVARILVEILLWGDDWLELLNSLRATHTEIEGRTLLLEKYSSMGNGFTFELETLIFQSLCETICGNDYYSVYGDDIIVETKHAEAVIKALEFFGFVTNSKKTFCDGPFRESCGGDFFRGMPVRAHYLKELPDDPQSWMALHNGICRIEDQGIPLSSVRHSCLDAVPSEYRRLRGPRRLGDAVFRDDDAVPVLRSYATVTGGVAWSNSPAYFYRGLITQPHSYELARHFPLKIVMQAASLGVPPQVSLRGAPKSFRKVWLAAYGIEGTGDWCG